MVLKQHSSSTDAGGDGESGSSAAVPATAGQLVAMMSGDWEKAVVEADMFWLALNLARCITLLLLCLCTHILYTYFVFV